MLLDLGFMTRAISCVDCITMKWLRSVWYQIRRLSVESGTVGRKRLGCFGVMTLLPSLAVLAAIVLWFGPARVAAQNVASDLESARVLDALLQDYTYNALVRPKTGVPYDGIVPGNLTGVKISAIRLRSGSLRARGVPSYMEFEIPTRVIVRPYVVRLVLVYQNLGNWSSVYYPLPGYTHVAPVLGLLAYDASNLSAADLPELDIEASGGPVVINFSSFIPVLPPGTLQPKCVRFNLNGSVNLSSFVSNMCSTTQQGHFSVVIESTAPSPGMAVLPSSPSGGSQKSSKRDGKIVGSVIGGSAVLVVLALLALWVRKHKRRHHIQKMERAADVGESLHVASVGDTRAPSATVTRTQPLLEHEYVP